MNVLLVLILALATPALAHDLEVGEKFPSLQLPSLADGSPASIRDFQGSKLMLHVWASW